MNKEETEKIRVNREFIDKQRLSFNPGNTIKELLAVSIRHPFISLLFILSFAVFTNSIYSLLTQIVPSNYANTNDAVYYLYFAGGSLFVMGCIIAGFKIQGLRVYRNVPLYQKKALIVISAPNNDYKNTAAYNFISSMLYDENNSSKRNLVEKIYIVSSEDKKVVEVANKLKKYCEVQNRDAEILQINIQGIDKNVESLKKQLNETIKGKVLSHYKAEEIIADFTGGTKEMSVALYLVCLDNFVLPSYLNVPKILK